MHVMFVIPIMFLFIRDNGTKRLLTYLNMLVFIWYALTVVQSIVYAKTGSFLFAFKDYYYYGGVIIRNSSIRVTQGTFGTIMFLYNACVVFFENKKRISCCVCSANKSDDNYFSSMFGIYCVILRKKR